MADCDDRKAENPESKVASTPSQGPKILSMVRQPVHADSSGRYLYYPGAKDTILDAVLHLVPHDAIRLIDPFTGSGALASGIAFRFRSIEASDLNSELIEAHKKTVENTDQFLAELETLFNASGSTEKSFYDAVRNRFNASSSLAEKAALLVFLNRKGFKGLMRRNLQGEFNVPFWGQRADEQIPAGQAKEFADRLAGKTTFSSRTFEEALADAGAGDFCYLDPPYLPEEGKDETFSEYVGAFGEEDHIRLATLCREAADRGATVVVSNHDSTRIRQIYRSANQIYLLEVPRGMSDAQGKRETTAKEILATWRPRPSMIEPFIRKPPLGQAPERYGRWADRATLIRRVYEIAEQEDWLATGADPAHVTHRTFRESGRWLLSIAVHGSSTLRQLALENRGRAKRLSLQLLESLIYSDTNLPPEDLLPEEEAASILLDLAQRVEKTLKNHPLAENILVRVLKTKARIFIAKRPEVERLQFKHLPGRYKAVLEAIQVRNWEFRSEPCQRLLLYAELCADRGSKDFIQICQRVADGLSKQTLLNALVSIKVGDGRGVGETAHAVIEPGAMKRIRQRVGDGA